MADRWKMPDWMKPFAPMFLNTGREPTVAAIEEMYNGRTDPVINLPLSTLEACVKTQVGLLTVLRREGALSFLHFDQNREAGSGRYTFDGDMSKLCRCGHKLGAHIAGGYECGTDPNGYPETRGCKCQRFKLSRKRRAQTAGQSGGEK